MVTIDEVRAVAEKLPRSSEGLADLGLEPRLLVEADLEVREHGELHASLRIALVPQALVPRERLAQVALTFRRVARPQAVERLLAVEVASELEADLLEHLQVAARDGVARQLDGVERRVQLCRQAPQARLALKEPAAHQPPPEGRERMQ